jgi:hypothetical protein
MKSKPPSSAEPIEHQAEPETTPTPHPADVENPSSQGPDLVGSDQPY